MNFFELYIASSLVTGDDGKSGGPIAVVELLRRLGWPAREMQFYKQAELQSRAYRSQPVSDGPSKSSSNEELSKYMEHHMAAVLSALVNEAGQLDYSVASL